LELQDIGNLYIEWHTQEEHILPNMAGAYFAKMQERSENNHNQTCEEMCSQEISEKVFEKEIQDQEEEREVN